MKLIVQFGSCLFVAATGLLGSQAHAQVVDRVIIGPTTVRPVEEMVTALTADNRVVDGVRIPIVVEICGVELDLTGQSLTLGSDVALIASPGCARGPRSRGPLIYIRDNRGSDRSLFKVRGDNVRLSGFRLQGPSDGIGSGDDELERGIYIWPFACPGLDLEECNDPAKNTIRNIEVSNMEIFYWSGAGIAIGDNTEVLERGRLTNANEGAVRISSNFLHHNRHDHGNGYGVDVKGGAYALIERNVFDQNRHAIAGGSSDGKKDFSGYSARDNLILSGGGSHCRAWIICWRTHQVDMHGDQNAWYSNSNWCCGTAGETLLIERNTFLYDAGNAIKIRGNPADKAVLDGNVFKHGSQSDAIAQNGDLGFGDNIRNPIDVRPNNVFGLDSSTELGACNFVGLGQHDRVMATGVTWWAYSPDTGQWRYLNTMPERLSEIQFEDVGNDGKCDVVKRPISPVLPPRTWSENGTGPWKPIMMLDPN